jgi:hypothetical protein
MLALQSSIGNAATTRLLHTAVSRATLARRTEPPADPLQVQGLLEVAFQQVSVMVAMLRSQLIPAIGPDASGFATGRQGCLAMLDVAASAVDVAARAIAELWAPEEAGDAMEQRHRDAIDQGIGELRAAFPVWRKRLEELEPADVATVGPMAGEVELMVAQIRVQLIAFPGALSQRPAAPAAAAPAVAAPAASSPPAAAAPLIRAAPAAAPKPTSFQGRQPPPGRAGSDSALLEQVDRYIARGSSYEHPVREVWLHEFIDPEDALMQAKWETAAEIVEWRAKEAREAGNAAAAAWLELCSRWKPPGGTEDSMDVGQRASIMRFLRAKGPSTLSQIADGIGLRPSIVQVHLDELLRPKGNSTHLSGAPAPVSSLGGDRWSAAPRR